MRRSQAEPEGHKVLAELVSHSCPRGNEAV